MRIILMGLLQILVIVTGFLLSQLLGRKIDKKKSEKNIEKEEKK